MAFDQIYPIWIPSGLGIRGSQRATLPFAIGCQETATNIVGKPCTMDCGPDAVSCTLGIGQTFQQEHTSPFSHDQTVGTPIEGGTASVRRKRPQLGEAHLGVETIRASHPTRKDCVSAAGAEITARQVEGV